MKLTALFLISTCLATGCSSSGNDHPQALSHPSMDAVTSTDSVENTEPATSTGPVESTEPVSSVDPVTNTDPVESTDPEEGTGPVENSAPDSTGADPLVKNSIPVYFDITVPVYQSNELRVKLTWSDKRFTASWAGDEHWTANSEFPTETENLLTVTFYDRNGDIELASVSQAYRTGSNAVEPLHIAAEQFNADQFDTDEDGVSNLAELIRNTDPLVDEDATLPLQEAFYISNTLSVSQALEAQLPDQRPYVAEEGDFIDYPTNGPIGDYSSIAIDADGNGTSTKTTYDRFNFQRDLRANRTHSGSAIQWEGRLRTYDNDYARLIDFTNDVTVVDDTNRRFVQEFTHDYHGLYIDRWESSSDLTGALIADTSRCAPESGSVSITHWTNRDASSGDGKTIRYEAVKSVGDPYWRITVLDRPSEGSGPEIRPPADYEIRTTEYFARELRLAPVVAQFPGNAADTGDTRASTFICDFVDIP